jgi:iron complex outermembrane receptor protein
LKTICKALIASAAIGYISLVHADELDFLFEDEESSEQTESPPESRSTSQEDPSGSDQSKSESSDESADPDLDAEQGDKLADAADVQKADKEPVQRSNRRVIEEVVVTAQKREESINDVALSVSALDGEAMKDANIENMNDLTLYTPNVKFNVTPNSNFVTMRGLGTGENRGFEQAVGLAVDGVYYGRSDYLLSALLDMERVEVLRGPQGTLFGKNTIAGALNVVTGNPEEEFRGNLEILSGAFNQHRYRGMVTAPITDTMGFRFAIIDEEKDGFIYNTTLDRMESNLDNTAWRAKFAWHPSDVFSLTISMDHNRIGQIGAGYQLTAATDESLTTYQTNDPQTETNLDYVSSTDAPLAGGSRRMQGGYFHMDWDVGEYTLTAIGGHSELDVFQYVDADFSPTEFLTFFNIDTYNQQQGELRMISPPGDFEWVAGLFYFQSHYVVNNTIEVDANGFIGAPIPIPGIDDATYKTLDQITKSSAIFGQSTWYMTDRLALITGLRYTQEKKTGDMSLDFLSTGVTQQAILGEEEYETFEMRAEKEWTPKVSLKFDVTEEIMTFAAIAQGFKGGGFNAESPTDKFIQFEPENALTFEIGTKMSLLGGAMNINMGLFHTDFENLQVSVFNGTGFVVGNAANAVTRGLEMDGLWLLGERTTLTFSLGLTDAKYASYTDGPCQADGKVGERERDTNGDGNCNFQDLTGETLHRAPKVNGNIGFDYSIPFNNSGIDIVFGGSALYQSDYFLNLDLDPLDFQEAYWQYNARVAARSQDDSWTVSLNARNLSNEIVQMEGADVPIFEGNHFAKVDLPRTASVELRINF